MRVMNVPPQVQAPPKSKPIPTVLIVLMALGGALVLFGGVFAALGIYGVRKYIANAKTAEARNSLGQIGQVAALAYEKNHALCPSASKPIPANAASIRGTKYQSTEAEWKADARKHAGFACLGFWISTPQYFQYSYDATPDGQFTATAHGDLNGNGKLSTFILRGHVSGNTLMVSPTIDETDPEE
jgi:type IV pilus assembly protein PilA